MPVVDKNPDGSLSVRIFYKDLSMEAITEIDACLAEYGQGMLYDHIVEEFAISVVDVAKPEPVVSLGSFKDHLNKS
jgi:hypothetical protein